MAFEKSPHLRVQRLRGLIRLCFTIGCLTDRRGRKLDRKIMACILTTAFLVTGVGTVNFPVAATRPGYACGSGPAVYVTLAAVSAVLLIGEVRTIDDTVADARRQSLRLQFPDAACGQGGEAGSDASNF
jgi:hypothetical protein